MPKKIKEVLNWKVPEAMQIPPDKLKVRLDFFENSIISYSYDRGKTFMKRVSANDLSLALMSKNQVCTGLLPKNTLWYIQKAAGTEIAIWRAPQVWKVTLQYEPMKPVLRFSLPLPGLIFLCMAGKPPSVFAMKEYPKSISDVVYNAPFYNTHTGGSTCQGTTKYPLDINKIPEAFFLSTFSKELAGDRSKKFESDLVELWKEIDGKKKYPLEDLVKFGTINNLLQ